MFKLISDLTSASVFCVVVCFITTALANGNKHILKSVSRDVWLDGDRVVIKEGVGYQAVIKETGVLKISGKYVAVPLADQKLFIKYYKIVFEIKKQAKTISKKADNSSLKTFDEMFMASLSGYDSAVVESKEEKKLHLSLHTTIEALCDNVREIKKIQDKIVIDIHAFKPYAVVKNSDIKACNNLTAL